MAFLVRTRRSARLPRAVAVLTVLSIVLAACAGPSVGVTAVPPTARFDAVLAMHTAGYVGCPHAEITIVDYHVAQFDRAVGELPISEAWTARCRGATFFDLESLLGVRLEVDLPEARSVEASQRATSCSSGSSRRRSSGSEVTTTAPRARPRIAT